LHVFLVTAQPGAHPRRVARLLLDAGHRVTLVGAYDPKPGVSERYHYCPFPTEVPGLARLRRLGVGNALEPWIRAAQLRALCVRHRPDVINVQWVDRNAWLCALARVRPLVLSCWGSDINDLFTPGRVTPQRRAQVAQALAAADHVTADATDLLERCRQLAGRELATTLWHFGVDFSLFRPGYAAEARVLRERLHIPDDARVLLSVRRQAPFLGQTHIVAALAQLTRDPAVPKTVLILRDYHSHPETEQEVREQITALGVEEAVRWVGDAPQSELPAQYALADVVVNYPERDAFPVSLFEAAACQRPIVTSALPAYAGVFGDTLVNVPPGDPSALAAALKACLLEAPAAARPRLEGAYTIAQQLGDQDANLKRVTDMFASLRRRRFAAFPARRSAPARGA